MVESGKVRADRFVLIACAAFALVMTALTLGAAAPVGGAGIIASFIVLGLAPYAFTAILSLIQPMRRLVVASARAVAVVFGLFDCGLRYLALYHPQSSTDAIVVAVLPFWWVPTVVVVAALTAADALGRVPADGPARLRLTGSAPCGSPTLARDLNVPRRYDLP